MEAVDHDTCESVKISPKDIPSADKHKMTPESKEGADLPQGTKRIEIVLEKPATVRSTEILPGSNIPSSGATVDYYGPKDAKKPLNEKPVELTVQKDGSLAASPKDIPAGLIHTVNIDIGDIPNGKAPTNVRLSVEACTEGKQQQQTTTKKSKSSCDSQLSSRCLLC